MFYERASVNDISANGTLYISSTWNIQGSVIGRHKIQIPFELLEIVHLLFGT